MARAGVQGQRRDEDGSILILAYAISATLVMWVGSLLTRGAVDLSAAERTTTTLRAFHLAEAGLDDALVQLRAGASGSIPATATPTGSYRTTITPDGSGIVNRYVLQGFGRSSQDPEQTVEAIVQVTPSPPFRWGLFGIDEVEVRGNMTTDSFNSSQGTYAQTVGANGDIGTNAVRVNSLTVGGNALVNGDLFVGAGGDPDRAILIRGSAVITGSPQAAEQPTVFDPSQIPPGVSNAGPLRLRANEQLTLTEGTYWFAGIRAEARSSIQTAGQVTIYVTGAVDFRGQAMIGAGNQPTALHLNILGNPNVRIEGGGLLVGAIYAPEATVVVRGNAEVYGAIVGRALRLEGNATVHYDEALAEGAPQNQNTTVTVLSWRVP